LIINLFNITGISQPILVCQYECETIPARGDTVMVEGMAGVWLVSGSRHVVSAHGPTLVRVDLFAAFISQEGTWAVAQGSLPLDAPRPRCDYRGVEGDRCIGDSGHGYRHTWNNERVLITKETKP